MPDWMKILFPSLTAVLAAYLSARWAVQRTYKEKWWERRERAYVEIIDALHDIIRYLDMQANELIQYMHSGDSEHPKKKEFEEKYNEAYWKVQKVTDIGAFVISDAASSVLKELRERPSLSWDENPIWEVLQEDAKHYREALSKIRECAKKELQV